jgi:prevent-host-death family protein
MRSIELLKGALDLAECADDVREGEPIVLTKDGQPVAALVAIDDFDVENWKLSQNQKFLGILERSRRSATEGRSYSHREVLDALGDDADLEDKRSA